MSTMQIILVNSGELNNGTVMEGILRVSEVNKKSVYFCSKNLIHIIAQLMRMNMLCYSQCEVR